MFFPNLRLLTPFVLTCWVSFSWGWYFFFFLGQFPAVSGPMYGLLGLYAIWGADVARVAGLVDGLVLSPMVIVLPLSTGLSSVTVGSDLSQEILPLHHGPDGRPILPIMFTVSFLRWLPTTIVSSLGTDSMFSHPILTLATASSVLLAVASSMSNRWANLATTLLRSHRFQWCNGSPLMVIVAVIGKSCIGLSSSSHHLYTPWNRRCGPSKEWMFFRQRGSVHPPTGG